jgi:RecJ-like exonuclease
MIFVCTACDGVGHDPYGEECRMCLGVGWIDDYIDPAQWARIETRLERCPEIEEEDWQDSEPFF